MSLISRPYYSLACDFPGCVATSGDDGDYSAWGDVEQAYEDAYNNEWIAGTSLGDYCTEHQEPNPDEDAEEPRIPERVRTGAAAVEHEVGKILAATLLKFDNLIQSRTARSWFRYGKVGK